MPTPFNAYGGPPRPLDVRRTLDPKDAAKRDAIMARVKARKPLRKADIEYLRTTLNLSVWERNGRVVL